MTSASNQSSLATQLLAAWRWIKIAAGVAVVLFMFVLLAQAWSVVRMANDVHPWLGAATAIALLAALGYLIGVPISKYLKTPRVVEPPKFSDADGVQAGELRQVVKYLDKVLVHAESNPHLRETHAKIAPARAELEAFRKRAAGVSDRDAGALDRELAAWADATLAPIWKPVESRVEQMIYQQALTVGVATAVSPNGTLDAYLMLWRSANLVGEIATLYYGRPGLVGTFAVCRDVAVATAVAGTIQSVTDSLGNIAMHSIGGAAGVLAGPVTEGVTNALVFTRIGYLAQARCRAYRPWSQSQQKNALLGALSATQKVALGLTGEIVRKAGVGIGAIVGATASGLSAAMESAGERVATAAGAAVQSAAEIGSALRSRLFGSAPAGK